jgi:hypothetical protein
MGRKNWNYSTTRNRMENNFYKGFSNEGLIDYNQRLLKRYKIKEKDLTEWELTYYTSIKNQEFKITDKQLTILIRIYEKYSSTKI